MYRIPLVYCSKFVKVSPENIFGLGIHLGDESRFTQKLDDLVISKRTCALPTAVNHTSEVKVIPPTILSFTKNSTTRRRRNVCFTIFIVDDHHDPLTTYLLLFNKIKHSR